MITKPKKKKCKTCRDPFLPLRPMQIVCSSACALVQASKQSAKQAEQKSKRERQEIRERKLECKPLQYWLKRAEKAFNAWVRERDRDNPCMACGTYDSPEWHASHFVAVGVSSALRFNESNVHKSCAKCNVFLGGNLLNYETRLRAKLGDHVVDHLKTCQRSKKWTREELLDIEKKYKSMLAKSE